MTVAEVKETLQGAGVNLNDAQFEAIHSLLGSGGGDSSHTVDIMDVTNGASIELLRDPRVYFEVLTEVQSYTLNDQSLENTYFFTWNSENQFVGNIRFHSSDEQYDINPFAISGKPFSDGLRISADKIPYVIDLILHRFLPGALSYGNFVLSYPYNVGLSALYTADAMTDDGEGNYYFDEQAVIKNISQYIYDNNHDSINVGTIKGYSWSPDFSVCSFFESTQTDTYEVIFINVDEEVFPNGEKVWIPIVLKNISGVSTPIMGWL